MVPLYDAVGKHHGVFLYCAVLLALLAPTGDWHSVVLVGLPSLTVLSGGYRLLSLRRGR